MKYEVIDCTNLPLECTDPKFPECKQYLKERFGKELDDLDLVIFKNKTFTKQYFPKENKFFIVPFFVDCVFKPVTGQVLKSYKIKDATVTIYKTDGIQPIYAIDIPSIRLKFDKLYQLFEQYEKKNVSDELLQTWINNHGVLSYLFEDKSILEININPPEYEHPFRIVHQEFDECISNIFPSVDFLNYLSTFMKISTGRPLNKAQPQLDGELHIGNQRGRVAAVVAPFSVFGTGYSIRKHREEPWTLPLFMQNKAVNGWFAALMGFSIAHGRTFLVAGPRGSGKTSVLGSLILEILPKYRMITIEDTLELPINSYKSLGYNIVPLKVKSALMQHGMEISFDLGLRTSLRMGDSCLIVGEVRSQEAKVLYEAMRVGALSNVVGGTIHADTPYGVYDRVVNDLGVTKGSFKATDLIIIVNQIKSPSGLTRQRRVLSVVEVKKDWEDKPEFTELLVYSPKTDALEPTDALLNGKSDMIKDVLSKTRGFKNYAGVIEDIKLRMWAKNEQLDLLERFENALEAETTLYANMKFANLYEEMKPLDSEENKKKFMKKFKEELLI